jgi:hypothetical protein
MHVDHIRYDILVQDALRGMVRDILAETAKNGLPGDHHFFITFDTNAEGVRMSARLREKYPKEMTIVLQHQFWDLKVTDKSFEVGLSFDGVPERLFIPLMAIKGFSDPSVEFGLQFEALTLAPDETEEPEADAARAGPPQKSQAADKQRPARTSVPASPPPRLDEALPPADKAPASAEPSPAPPADKPGADVVRLDRFRKK